MPFARQNASKRRLPHQLLNAVVAASVQQRFSDVRLWFAPQFCQLFARNNPFLLADCGRMLGLLRASQ